MGGKLYPLSAPGMSVPGQDFLDAATIQGDELQFEGKGKKRRLKGEHPRLFSLVHQALYGRGELTLSVSASAQRRVVLNFVAGHVWREGPGDPRTTGPEPCDVMVVGSMCTDEDQQAKRLLQGRPGQYFLQTLSRLGLSCAGWYVTNLLKTISPDSQVASPKATWFQSQQFLLEQELRLVQPKYILCLGSEATKFFFGKNMSLDKARGQILEYEYPVGKSDANVKLCSAQVITTLSPSYVSREKGSGFRERFERDLANFAQLTAGVRCDQVETDIEHITIRSLTQLKQVLRRAEAENPSKLVAVDAEWHGNHPQNDGAYLRCVQFSWADKKAACVVLRAAGGEPDFWHTVEMPDGKKAVTVYGGQEAAIRLLNEYFADKRVVGHFFNSDLEWLVHCGLDLRRQFDAPEKWTECLTKGGWDTGLMMHALDETAAFDLTTLALKYTTAPRYDAALDKWKADFCKRNKLKASQLDGYGECPDAVLYPYATYDADVTRRIAIKLSPLLTKDAYGNNCWKPFWLAQRVAKVAYEINTTGLLVDRQRLDGLFDVYSDKKAEMLQNLKQEFNWPSLNMGSVPQVQELLFGEQYNNNRDKTTNAPIKLRPPGALSLYAQPVLSTGKRPKAWAEVIAEKKEREYSASTGKQALGILLQEADRMKVRQGKGWVVKNCGRQVQMVRDYRFIEQVLKFVLRPPATQEVEDEDESVHEEFLSDDDGYIYDRGIPGQICSDCRIRTNMSQVKETGRWASSRPPLQNYSKRREEDYARILAERYTSPLRSMFVADDGHLLVEADFVGAELFGMAILSGDVQMIDHARRNQLPEDHPDFYDIHSNIAVLAFGYKCPPTKTGLKAIGKAHMRIVAKSVVFGVAYGRGAKAIALAAREEGVTVSVEEAQKVIDTIFEMYPALVDFFAECRARCSSGGAKTPPPGWLRNAFGRYRRFPATRDREVLAEFERQAMNFPIQSLIADAMNCAMSQLYRYRDKHQLNFKFLLQIHDSLLFLVPNAEVSHFIDTVVPVCMERGVPIYPTSLDGRRKEEAVAHYLKTDVEVAVHWGDPVYPHECVARGIHPKYAHWRRSKLAKDAWESGSFPKKVYLARDRRMHKLTDEGTLVL